MRKREREKTGKKENTIFFPFFYVMKEKTSMQCGI